MTDRGLRAFAGGGILCAVLGCGLPPSPAPADAVPSAARPAASTALPAPPVADAGGELIEASVGDAGRVEDAGADREKIVPDNRVQPPLAGDELTRRARSLFDAIVRDDPAPGEPFWFPKEPFIPLKDVKGPDRYWENLHGSYVRDIHALHRKRKSWTGAEFVDFTVGSTPKWVKPGDEANRIGYYRSFRGKLRYRIDQALTTIEVHTIISWQGKWYITHLRKFNK